MHHRQKPIRKSSTGNPVTRTLRENPSTFVLPAGWAGCFLLRPWFLYGSNARIANAACALKQHPKTVSTRHETHRSHEVISIFPFCTVPSPTAGRRVFQNTNTSNICTQILSGRLQNRETIPLPASRQHSFKLVYPNFPDQFADTIPILASGSVQQVLCGVSPT